MIKTWIKAFRLRTLFLSIGVIFMGTATAQLYGKFNFHLFSFTLLTTICLQILSNLANDYGDFAKGTDNESRVGPQRTLQSGAITPKSMMIGIVFFVILSLLFGIVLLILSYNNIGSNGVISLFSIGILSIIAAIKYTMGKAAFGYKALGDVFVFIFFGLVGVVATFYLQTGTITLSITLPATTVGLLSVGVLNMNNLRDIITDKQSNKVTIAGLLGEHNSITYQNLLIVISFTCLLGFGILNKFDSIHYLCLTPYSLLIVHLLKINNIRFTNYDSQLKLIAISTFLISTFLWVSLNF